MAVSVIETIKSRANASNTAYIVVVKLLCDDYSDLPTQLGLTGYELAQGCIAHVINENKDFMIDSSGNWHVYGGDSWTNVYTKSETDALLDEKQDELTTSQLEAVNSGITAADVAALATKVTLEDIYGLGTSIPANSDLDDYLTIGIYNIISSAVAATIANLPVSVGGRLEIKALNVVNRYLQVYYAGDGVFQRRWNGTSWSPWYQYTLTVV